MVKIFTQFSLSNFLLYIEQNIFPPEIVSPRTLNYYIDAIHDQFVIASLIGLFIVAKTYSDDKRGF